MAFKSLVGAISEQRQEIKEALASLTYFETWDAEAIGECCRISSVAEFAPDKIILGPDNGNSHTVYFILEGVCKMVRHMYVKSRPSRKASGFHTKNQIFQYKRYRHSDSKTLNSESKNEGFKSRLLNTKDFPTTNPDGDGSQPADSPPEQLEETVQGTEEEAEVLVEESEGVKETAAECGNGKESNNREEGNTENNPSEEQKVELTEEEAIEVPEVKYEPDHHLKVLEECKKRRNEMISDCKKGVLPEKPKNVRSVFIQIGFLLKGACFGLEKIENFIITSTKVKCLKIPQRFLLKHNPCNIWNRIRLFHSLYLPKDEIIFEKFRSDRLWTEWKKKLSEEIASKRNLHNYTLDSDVPYSLRLVERR